MEGNEIRTKFLEFFRERGHTVVPSSPLIPEGDPTLLFTNAGMVQFKDVFLGNEKRAYTKAVTSQKCVRAGGKHNDLDSVGRTARHHTFFEMLGNFSFGDYFKRDAIAYAWEFLTEVLGLPRERLWPTIYREDDEAFELWREIANVPSHKIIRLGEKDNFWSMGDTGPCGPCSEIVLDRGAHLACGPDCGIGTCDCDRWLEIWNLVFMQYNRDADGEMTPLPKPSIDTGMGLERIASVLQGVATTFETDLIYPVIAEIERMCGRQYDRGEEGFPFRVIADHARSCTFLICDGVLPSNEGRGYVLRRILRRAVRYGRVLGIEGAFLWRLVPVVGQILGGQYRELVDKRELAEKVIKMEEERFLMTLSEGTRMAEHMIEESLAAGLQMLPGDKAFMLYDTYGFPPDLAEDMAREKGLAFDRQGFEQAMKRQREQGRAAWQASHGEMIPALQSEKTPVTEFVGYDRLAANALVVAMIRENESVDVLSLGESGLVFLDETPFYPEGGGQVSDMGVLSSEQAVAEVKEVRRLPSGHIAHYVEVKQGELRRGDMLSARVDERRRIDAARNHTATHLLHRALKQVLGEHANQAGSLVAPDRLRFDFTHFAPLSPEELFEVGRTVNSWIMACLPIEARIMSFERAQEMGAIALFGEKYHDEVRVISIDGVSKELCGGTHVRNTGEIGLFRITAESSVGSGLRRIEAVTGWNLLNVLDCLTTTVEEACTIVRSSPGELVQKLKELQERVKAAERKALEVQKSVALEAVNGILQSARSIDGVKVVSGVVPVDSMDALRRAGDTLRNKIGSGVVVIGAPVEGKALFVAMVTKDLTDRIHAGRILSEVAKTAGGGGGGRPDMAQAGAPDPGKITDALGRVDLIIGRMLSN